MIVPNVGAAIAALTAAQAASTTTMALGVAARGSGVAPGQPSAPQKPGLKARAKRFAVLFLAGLAVLLGLACLVGAFAAFGALMAMLLGLHPVFGAVPAGGLAFAAALFALLEASM